MSEDNQMARQLVSLPEFQSLCGLSDRATIRLLSLGEIPVQLGAEGQILIPLADVRYEEVAINSIATEDQNRPLPTDPKLIKEIISSEILKEMDGILIEAVDLAIQWSKPPVDNSDSSTGNK